MFGCNFLRCRFMRIVHHGKRVAVDMGYDLIPECEESVFMGFFIFVNMNRRNFKGTVPIRADFVVGDAFVVLFDVDHQHVEME